jgi:hypothetical protein
VVCLQLLALLAARSVAMGRASVLVSLLAAASCVSGASLKRWQGETRTENGVKYQCKCYSDNACWPTSREWGQLNSTVDGTLRTALPPGAVCYKTVQGVAVATYNAAECSEVRANWQNEQYL